MNNNYLFPSRYKKIGLTILVPTLITGMLSLIYSTEPAFLDVNVLAVFEQQFSNRPLFFTIVENNILNEICGVLLIISLVLVAFSKERQEDEFISQIRLESLVWATYFNYFVLLLSMIFVYHISFLWVMIFNIFTLLFFFIIRFNWQVWKLKRSDSNEK